jgi:hypothetical protein
MRARYEIFSTVSMGPWISFIDFIHRSFIDGDGGGKVKGEGGVDD